MLLILQLFSAVFCSEDYVRSLFGAPGRNEVEVEYVDGFEVLERNLQKPKLKHIKEAKFTELINDEDYPYPGHSMNGTCTWQKMRQETTTIRATYNISNLSEKDLYWHPAGAKQFYTTNEEVAAAERVSVRYVIHPKYNRHVPPVWMPPGELVTMKIKSQAINRVYVTFNKYMSNIWDIEGKPKYDRRVDNPHIDRIPLQQEVNTLGLPYGATINFDISGNEPIEVIIKGVILCPFFIYGVHSDTEWKNHLSKLPGPFTNLESGNLEIATPATFVRSATRLNDCMKWYRSAGQISQTAAQDGYNSKFGRPLNILELNFETFVPAGAAVAFVGRSFCHYPPDWLSGFVNWDSLQGEPWGQLHEINHHHQNSWAMAIPAGAGEMSNNVLNLLAFARSNQAAQHRTETGGLSWWCRYSCSFFMLNNLDQIEYGLSLYSNMLHFFGYEKMREFIHADQYDKLYTRKEYGGPGSEMLRASVIFGRNMRHHYNFHTVNDTRLGDKALKELEKLKLPNFHPVTNPYACGFLTEGEQGFVTASPFYIPPYDYEIDFVGYMYQRNDTSKFGDHVFKTVEFEKGRENSWKVLTKGKYVVTPKTNPLEVEEVIVSYEDKETHEITRVICHFAQRLNSWELRRYNNMKGLNVSSAYSKVVNEQLKPTVRSYPTKSYIPKYEGDGSGYLSIMSGKMKVPSTTNYTFAATTESQVVLYLSENPLSFDPVKDERYKICHQRNHNLGFDNVDHSEPIYLEEGKTYYVALVSYGEKEGALSYIGYKTTDKFTDLPSSFMIGKEVDPKEKFESQFVPRFERMYTLDQYSDVNFIPQDSSNWNVYNYPEGDFIMNSNVEQGSKDPNRTVTQALTDSDATTEWRSKWWPVSDSNPKFPIIYDIDLGQQRTFSDVKIGGTGNTGWFDMNSPIEIRLAPNNFTIVNQNQTISFDSKNYSIEHNESIVFQGHYTTSKPVIELGKESTGRYLRIIFLDNNATWKDNRPCKTSVSTVEVGTAVNNQKVIPMTNKKDIKRNEKWYEVRGGLYYNGKGFTGVKGATLEFTIKKGQKAIGLIGDYYPNMGTATVKIDGQEVGTVHDTLLPVYDNKRLDFASRSYKTLLFYSRLDSSKEHTLSLEVDNGEITLSGLLVDEEIVTFESDAERYRNYTRGDILIKPTFVEADPEEEILFDYDQKNNEKPSPKKGGLSAGPIVAVVITVLVVVSAVIVVAVIFIKKPEILNKFR